MRQLFLLFVTCTGFVTALTACGPSSRDGSCIGSNCDMGSCSPGETRSCYTGPDNTLGVGPCDEGTQKCTAAGMWGSCEGQTIPVAENCTDGVDNNCNGAVDDDVDNDGDGFTSCGGDCCDSTECSDPELANPGAYDAAGNNIDDDCNGQVDDTLAICDNGLVSNSMNAKDFAKAIDLCQETTATDKKWGVISASFTLPDGNGTPEAVSHSIRPKFGASVMPRGGLNLAVLSSGAAAAKGDTNPDYEDFEFSHTGPNSSGFPADFMAANNNTLPNAPGCPPPDAAEGANDPVMLNLEIRVPTNAHSFSLKTNFYSAEFPEWTCSEFNDFFVILLDSAYTGAPANPMDKNLAFYTSSTMMNYPVGVNLAFGNTGLFTQCVNGPTGCAGLSVDGTITTCTGTNDLMGTGFDDPSTQCAAGSTMGGATGWLTTSGNVTPGEIIKLRIAIWDTSDHALDSLALIDGFQWSVDSTEPGTVILRSDQPTNPNAVDGTIPASFAKY